MNNSLKLLLSAVFDFSPMLQQTPPGLTQVFRQYVALTRSELSEAMSRFVIPHDQISKLSEFADYKHELNGPLSLCITSPQPETLDAFKNMVRTIESKIMSAHADYPGEVRTNILELAFPEASLETLNPEELVRAMESVVITSAASRILPHRVFFEVPAGQKNILNAKKIAKVIAVHNKSILKRKIDNYLFSGLKINVTDPDGKNTSTTDYLAELLIFARDANVALKFSGAECRLFSGIDYDTGEQQHGLINILLAGMIAYTQDLTVDETRQLLDDGNSSNFVFKDDYLAWRGLAAPTNELKMLRMLSITSINATKLGRLIDEMRHAALI